MSEITPAERLAALADGWTARDSWRGDVLTDGLNAASTWASENNQTYMVESAEYVPTLLESWARITGQITMRLDSFRPNPNADLVKQRDALLAVRDRTGCRIDLAVKPFGQKWTPGWRKDGEVDVFIRPEDHPWFNHNELIGFWFQCLRNAKAAGVRPRYVLMDHPPNMDAWKAGQSDELDALIQSRWDAMFDLVRWALPQGLRWYAGCMGDVNIIVYGQTFGKVLPKFRYTGWLSHNGYATNDLPREFAAYENLVRNQRNERLAWYFDARNRSEDQPADWWGRIFADRICQSGAWVPYDHPKRIDALVHWPCVFSTPESVEGVVSFLEGLRG